ncbi:unnamed protein product [Boreogadus saida]
MLIASLCAAIGSPVKGLHELKTPCVEKRSTRVPQGTLRRNRHHLVPLQTNSEVVNADEQPVGEDSPAPETAPPVTTSPSKRGPHHRDSPGAWCDSHPFEGHHNNLSRRQFSNFPQLTKVLDELTDGHLLVYTDHLKAVKANMEVSFRDLDQLAVPDWVMELLQLDAASRLFSQALHMQSKYRNPLDLFLLL